MLEVLLWGFLGNVTCFGLAFGFAALGRSFRRDGGKNE
jgi:hypothetical protein